MAAGADVIVRPQAKVQADPVAHGGDAADDSAIRVHPTDPAGSLILGTDKHGGLCVYGMEGRLGQLVSAEQRGRPLRLPPGALPGGPGGGSRSGPGYCPETNSLVSKRRWLKGLWNTAVRTNFCPIGIASSHASLN